MRRERTDTRPSLPKTSAKGTLQSQIAQVLSEASTTARWGRGGFQPDTRLLGRLLGLTDPKNTTGASVATALDMWAAEQLRAAGLRNVLPRPSEPYYVGTPAAWAHEQGVFGKLDAALARLESVGQQLQDTARPGRGVADRTVSRALARTAGEIQAARRSLTSALRELRREMERGTNTVLGEGRRKQIDVFSAAWDRGLEIAVSTKTLAVGVDREGELLKNLPNRWEEFDGDLKNLRGRFPIAVIGALLLLPEAAVNRPGMLVAVADMMSKLTAPGRPWANAYDAAAIVVASNWVVGQAEEVSILADNQLPPGLPSDLRLSRFFNELLNRLLDRSPITEHRDARQRRADALGADGAAYLEAARVMGATEAETADHTE